MELSHCTQFHSLLSQMKKNGSASPPARKTKYAGQSIRVIPLRILTVGKKRSQGVQLLVNEYMDKIKYYCSVEDVNLKSNPKSSSDVKAQIDAEDMIVMEHIKPKDWVIVLDEGGTDIGSEQLADLVGDAGRTGSTTLVFCIGGPYGHGPQLRKRANMTIRLSSMVLNHQVALVVLLEQLYSVVTPVVILVPATLPATLNRPSRAELTNVQSQAYPYNSEHGPLSMARSTIIRVTCQNHPGFAAFDGNFAVREHLKRHSFTG